MKKERKNLLTVARLNIESLFRKLFRTEQNSIQVKFEVAVPVVHNNAISIEIVHIESVVYDNVIEFWFKPNANIRIRKVEVSMADSNDEIRGDLVTEYERDNWYLLAGYEIVGNDNEWKFSFNGEEADTHIQFILKVKYVV